MFQHRTHYYRTATSRTHTVLLTYRGTTFIRENTTMELGQSMNGNHRSSLSDIFRTTVDRLCCRRLSTHYFRYVDRQTLCDRYAPSLVWGVRDRSQDLGQNRSYYDGAPSRCRTLFLVTPGSSWPFLSCALIRIRISFLCRTYVADGSP